MFTINNNILITGGAGFIGSNFIRYLLNKYPSYKVINLDKLTYAGNLENLVDIEGNPNYRFIKGDICDMAIVSSIIKEYNVEVIINFAAESHVDRSISAPNSFIQTNIVGTYTLLESAVNSNNRISRFIQISTDEVYGSLGITGKFTETSPIKPNSPYSATKASADLLVRSYYKTYGIPVIITRCSNNYGPYQFPEKLIPLFITNAMEDKQLPVYGDGLNVRDWIYVDDHSSAIDVILHKGKDGEIYNIGGDAENTNLEITDTILTLLNKPASLKKFVKDRPGHDRRYAMDYSKLHRELGWNPAITLEAGLKKTIEWYKMHETWWMRIKSGEYREYYDRQYNKQ